MSAAVVVYVHGLWMPGIEGFWLRRRLRRQHGYGWHTFRYGSVRESLGVITERLAQTLHELKTARVHLLGHSLGGLVIAQTLRRFPLASPGRVVFLGTPATGSRVASRLSQLPLGRQLLGSPIVDALVDAATQRWLPERELGIIAGSLPLGLGQVLLNFQEPNDGTVAVSETQLPGATATLTVPVSHMGLLASAQVAGLTGNFFEHGRFER